ncbi:MAG: thermonuclease family protein [Stellaceae bacterium]
MLLVIVSLIAVTGAAPARTITARVVRVIDGDTIVVRAADHVAYRIRLSGIDAPEYNQRFGRRATENLARLVAGKVVTLDCDGEESYGRPVCKILLSNGEDVDLDQLKAGAAWDYKQFDDEQTPRDRRLYAAAEDTAHEGRIGLWTDPDPNPPWAFRHDVTATLCFDGSDRRVACDADYHGAVRGNRRTSIYEWPGCPYYNAIAFHNRVPFRDAAAAEAAGYRPARNCP